jgi:hypothetical protein
VKAIKKNGKKKTMHILNNKNADSSESNLYRGSARITNGDVVIERVMYFERDSANEDGATITSLAVFPQKNSAHPLHPNFKYYGNATVEPIDSEGRYWRAVLEYSTSNPNAKDVDGKDVTSETAPWKLLPDNISFTYPETTLPFEFAYDSKGKLSIPVRNTAGDVIPATMSARNAQLSFTFNTQKWSPDEAIEYGNTINSQSIKVCGYKVKKYCGLLYPPEANYITVYQDGTNTVKWQYWSVNVTILFDLYGNTFNRIFLNVGNRAKFPDLSLSGDALLSDAGVGTNFAATPKASQICSFRKTIKSSSGGKNFYLPLGDQVFCSWEQYIVVRQAYLDASALLGDRIASTYELQCEQEQSMPLNGSGYLDYQAIETGKYGELWFQAYPEKSWNSLNLPSKGI